MVGFFSASSFLSFCLLLARSSSFLSSCLLSARSSSAKDETSYNVFDSLFFVDMASIVSFERMSNVHVGQSSCSFQSQVGPCHQNSFLFRILTVQPLDAISAGFWSVDTYRNSMPLFDWTSSIFLRTNGVRIFFDLTSVRRIVNLSTRSFYGFQAGNSA